MKKPNKYQAYRKVVQVIKSCTTESHLQAAFNMMCNYMILFGPDDTYGMKEAYTQQKQKVRWCIKKD